MSVRVAINGFGRIGRNVFRAARGRDTGFEIVAVNDLTSAATLAHLLRYDSVHGRYPGTVEAGDGKLVVDGRDVKVLSERDPATLPWGDLGVEIVVESTGFFTKREGAAKHLEAGARKVVISAPATGPDITVCIGVNDDQYDADQHHVISNASCTTNCLAPLAKVLVDSFGIKQGYILSYHVLQVNNARAGEPDLILATESKDYLTNAQQLEIQKKYEEFMAKDNRKMTSESGERKVMRKFVGGMELQELKLK
jgi:glyceraldehyde 3-phosphate dehydrogenase